MLFHILLNQLIDITAISKKDLAQTIGYHNSYISKWTSGSRLPSTKGSTELLQQMSEIFAKAIDEKDLRHKLEALSEHPVLLTDYDTIRNVIFSLLDDSFAESQMSQTLIAPTTKPKTIAITGHDRSLEYSLSLIWNTIKTAPHDLEFLITFNLFWLSVSDVLKDFDATITRDIDVQFKLTMSSMTESSYPADYFTSLFSLILRTAPFDINLYHQISDVNDLYMICKNRFCCHYIVNDKKEVEVMYYTEDPEIINYTLQSTERDFHQQNLLLQGIKEKDFEYLLYKGYKSQEPVTIAAMFMTGVFIDDEIIASLRARGALNEQTEREVYNIHKECARILQTTDMHLYSSEQIIKDFVRDGEVQLDVRSVRLNIEERRIFLQNFIDTMENNEAFKLYMYRNEVLPFDRKNTQYSFRHLPPQAYLKKDLAVAKKDSTLYYTVSSKDITDTILGLLHSTECIPGFTLTKEEAIEFVKESLRWL